jgi:hypothetical protein
MNAQGAVITRHSRVRDGGVAKLKGCSAIGSPRVASRVVVCDEFHIRRSRQKLFSGSVNIQRAAFWQLYPKVIF